MQSSAPPPSGSVDKEYLQKMIGGLAARRPIDEPFANAEIEKEWQQLIEDTQNAYAKVSVNADLDYFMRQLDMTLRPLFERQIAIYKEHHVKRSRKQKQRVVCAREGRADAAQLCLNLIDYSDRVKWKTDEEKLIYCEKMLRSIIEIKVTNPDMTYDLEDQFTFRFYHMRGLLQDCALKESATLLRAVESQYTFVDGGPI